MGHAGLAVTRAMGDADCKADGVTAAGSRVHLTPREDLVVACDLWDVVSNEECVKMIKDTVKEPNMCAKQLGSEALTRTAGNIAEIVGVPGRTSGASEGDVGARWNRSPTPSGSSASRRFDERFDSRSSDLEDAFRYKSTACRQNARKTRRKSIVPPEEEDPVRTARRPRRHPRTR